MTVAESDHPSESSRSADTDLIDKLFDTLRQHPADSADAASVRDEITAAAMPLARNIARRFAGRGEDLDDLNQVAYIGLLHAIDRFDPERGSGFTAFAVPTIMGEVRRYFRDHGWTTHVPRRIKDMTVSIGKVTDGLAQRLGRSPTAAEIAAEIGADTGEVIEALAARSAYQPASLDTPLDNGDDTAATLADTLGVEDDELERSEHYLTLRPLLEEVAPRERQILILRFFKEKSQSEIAREIGVSQVHVSRLLTRTLAEIRARLDDG
ncbi:SigB/SigF/SigG family RNA polymerase sigma factor [Rhodococcus triatomae]|nr:sigma-70 factor [Rhodococcus triatomae BKS 15-14]